MKDLTRGPIAYHVVTMAAPVAAAMLFQTLYYFVDLYFVSRLGDAALAGVSGAGNANFLIMALTQVLGVGTVALISQAVGRKDQAGATSTSTQSLAPWGLPGVLPWIAGSAIPAGYRRTAAADAAPAAAGTTYLRWFAPGLALQFALIAMSSALRGTGIVQP